MHLSTHKWVEDAIRLTHYCKPTMSLSRRRRREQAQRRRHPAGLIPGAAPEDSLREGEGSPFLPEQLFAQRERDESMDATPQSPSPDAEGDSTVTPPAVPSPGLRAAQKAQRLAYTRRQAAQALGVSLSTIDRHVVPAIETVKMPWGQRLIPADELKRLLRNHREAARSRPARRSTGRPATLPRSVVERIRLEYARGRSLAEIARALTGEGVPTAHGGRQWWPSTVRAVLVR
jgi:Recombinase